MKALVYRGELLAQFRSELNIAIEFHLAFALISEGGLGMLIENVTSCLERGGKGRVLIGIDMSTAPGAIEELCTLGPEFPRLDLRVFESGQGSIFHPKLAVFLRKSGAKTAIVGSANLTCGGFGDNYEADVFIDHTPTTTSLLNYFEEQFNGGHSKRITPRWLVGYWGVWEERQKIGVAIRKIRNKAIKIPRKDTEERIPTRIKGHTFAFTGGLRGDWFRESKLYPCIRQYDGDVAAKPGNMGRADCLVHADSLGQKGTTRKLIIAHQEGIPRISEDQFFQILAREKRICERRG